MADADTSLTMRRATEADLAAIVALLADDILGATRERAAGSVAPVYVEAFRRVDANPMHLLLVAEDAGRVVGTAQVTILDGLGRQGAVRAQVEAVRIAADRRGQGLGHRMMAWILDYARRRGAAVVQLTTDKRRRDAHRFYRSLGFEATHEGMKLALE